MILITRFPLTGWALAFYLVFNNSAASADAVVVVSAQSPINTLSERNLEDIYLGRINKLQDGKPILPVDQANSLPVHREFYREFLDRSPAQIKAHWSKLIFTGRGRPPPSVPHGAALADFIAGNPAAIGYIDANFVDDRLRVVVIE